MIVFQLICSSKKESIDRGCESFELAEKVVSRCLAQRGRENF